MELPGKPRLLAKAPHWGYLHTKSPEMSSAHRQEPCPGEPVITGAGEEAPAVADRDWRKQHTQKQQGLLSWDPGTPGPSFPCCVPCAFSCRSFSPSLLGQIHLNEQAKKLNLELKGQFVIVLEFSFVFIHMGTLLSLCMYECVLESSLISGRSS